MNQPIDGRAAVPAWRRYLRFLRPNLQGDIDDELEFHIAMIAERFVSEGMAPDEARARARREFGDLERARRLCADIGVERQRRLAASELLESIVSDVRFALRSLRRSPGFATAVVLTLALGIGASTAIFTVVRGVLLRPLPFADPDRLVHVWEVSPRGDDHNVVSAGNVESWKAQARSFSDLVAYRGSYGVGLTGTGEPTQVVVSDVMTGVMPLLGARAQLGRAIVRDDDAGDGREVVLSHRFWMRRFGGDPGVVGRRIELDARPFTVIGVMPPGFDFPAADVDLWRPVTSAQIDWTERRSHNWNVVARLAPGATLASAGAEMRTIASAIASEFPTFMTGYSANVTSLREDTVGGVRRVLLVLLTGALLLLVVACANIGNLLLARAVGRRREVAVRAALGAGRGRMLRQLLTETLVIACVGGVVGAAVAYLMTRGLVAAAPPDIPRLSAVRIDGLVIAFAVGTTLVSGLVFGIVPAVRLVLGGPGSGGLQQVLRASGDRSGSARGGRARAVLLVGELAVSLILLTGAGLLIRSAQRLASVDYGFRPAGLTTVQLDLPRARYESSIRHIAFYDRLVDRVSRLPHVTGVAATSEPFGSSAGMTFSFAIQGRPSSNPSGREDPQPLRAVTGDYFRVMGIPLLKGRAFGPGDRAGSPPVVIVNEALARTLWPEGNAVGSHISFAGQSGPWLEVVGIAGDTRTSAVDEPATPALYLPFAQKTWQWMSWLTLVVRTDASGSHETIESALRGAVWDLDPQLPIQRLAPLPELFRESIGRRRFATTLTGAFAAAALALGLVGMYGVLSYGVAQRRREFGIRLALGAGAGHVQRVVIGEALGVALIAVVVGVAGAIPLTRLLTGLLYEVSPNDPATFGSVALLVTAIAIVAAWIPARRATHIDPAITLRES